MKLRRKLLLTHDDNADDKERNQDCGTRAFGHDQEDSLHRACLKSVSICVSFLSEGKRVTRASFETAPFPSFQRRGGCAINKKTPFLSSADGVVGNFKQIRTRCDFTNHPVCAATPP